MEKRFAYPEDLIPRLRKVWRVGRPSKERVLALPRGRTLRHFLEVAFHASFHTEEQRMIAFRLALITRAAARAEAGSASLHQKFDLVEFTIPREFSVGEILRLAPATDLTKTIICVEPAPAGGPRERGALEIWGLIHTGPSWWQFTHGELAIGVPPPNCLAVSSTESGNLTISREGDVLLSLRRGEVATPSGQVLQQGPIGAFLEGAIESMYTDVCGELCLSQFGATTEEDQQPKRFYLGYIERVLFHIREKRHGGTLLIVPDSPGVNDRRFRRRLNVKYPATYDRTWSLLVSALALHRRYFDLYLKLWDRKSPIPVKRHYELFVLQGEREEMDRRIADSVSLVASTSGVDGAVVITDRLRLLGFGAEVIAAVPDLVEIHGARDPTARTTTRIPIDTFGTRHRSAFRFCWSEEDSVAFVVSQDGGVLGVKRTGERLVLWPDVTFHPLGI